MTAPLPAVSPAAARDLVLDELFDLTLYKRLRPAASPEMRRMLESLIPIETRHMEFWRGFFRLPPEELGAARRVKLAVLSGLCRIFGDAAIQLVLEGIEVHGIRKYLAVWESARGTPLGEAVRQVLNDELSHEDEIVTAGAERRMGPEKVRSIFLGFNDGCVEILGAVSGFVAVFKDGAHVLAAALSVAVAGALSMAAGAYVAAGSESEVADIEGAKSRFLNPAAPGFAPRVGPLSSAFLVGASYVVGALVPVTPFLCGARSLWPTVAAAGTAIVLVSAALAFLTGMDLRRRVLINLFIIAAAVGVTSAIGLLARRFWGISL